MHSMVEETPPSCARVRSMWCFLSFYQILFLWIVSKIAVFCLGMSSRRSKQHMHELIRKYI